MLILKRLTIWATEVVVQAFLLGLLLIGLLGHGQHASGKDVLALAYSVLFMFVITGYALTTAISRTIWTGRKIVLPSAIATTLFLIHFEVINFAAGGAFEPKDRAHIRLAGACIAFLTTLAGTVALRRWTGGWPRSRL